MGSQTETQEQSQPNPLEQEDSEPVRDDEAEIADEEDQSDTVPPPLPLSWSLRGSSFSPWGLTPNGPIRSQSTANKNLDATAAQTGPHQRGRTPAASQISPIKSTQRLTASQPAATLEQHLTSFFDPSA